MRKAQVYLKEGEDGGGGYLRKVGDDNSDENEDGEGDLWFVVTRCASPCSCSYSLSIRWCLQEEWYPACIVFCRLLLCW